MAIADPPVPPPAAERSERLALLVYELLDADDPGISRLAKRSLQGRGSRTDEKDLRRAGDVERIPPMSPHVVLATSSLVPAAFGLAGTLIGGIVAGTVSYIVAKQAREAAEKSWIRDTRREVFDRFLTRAQALQAACEIHNAGSKDAKSTEAVEAAFDSFFNAYAVVQTIAEAKVVNAARVHGYRLHELRDEALGKRGKLNPPNFAAVDQLVRDARHKTIEAMRDELRLSAIEPPGDDFNAFAGTDLESFFVPRATSGAGS